MIKVGITEVSTFLEPSAAASATTELAGLLETAALGTSFIATYRRCSRRPGRFCGNPGVK